MSVDIVKLIQDSIQDGKQLTPADLTITDMQDLMITLNAPGSKELADLKKLLQNTKKKSPATGVVDQSEIDFRKCEQWLNRVGTLQSAAPSKVINDLVLLSKVIYERTEKPVSQIKISTEAPPVIVQQTDEPKEERKEEPVPHIAQVENPNNTQAHEYLRHLKMLSHDYSALDKNGALNACETDALKLMQISLDKIFRASNYGLNLLDQADLSDMHRAQTAKDRAIIAAFLDKGARPTISESGNKLQFTVNDKDKTPLLNCVSQKREDNSWDTITYTLTKEALAKYSGEDRSILLDFMAQQVAKIAKRAIIDEGQTAVFVDIADHNTEDLIRSTFSLIHNQVIPVLDAPSLARFKAKVDELEGKKENLSPDDQKLLWKANLIIKFKSTVGGDQDFADTMGLPNAPKEATNHTMAVAIQSAAQSYRSIITDPNSGLSQDVKTEMSGYLNKSDAKAKLVLSKAPTAGVTAQQQVRQVKQLNV